jgi:hypothetical protein
LAILALWSLQRARPPQAVQAQCRFQSEQADLAQGVRCQWLLVLQQAPTLLAAPPALKQAPVVVAGTLSLARVLAVLVLGGVHT